MIKGKDLRGAFVAIVTPFKNDKVDFESLARLVEFQIENGTHGIVACGTTGEAPTLSHEEHQEVIKFVVQKVKQRVPVLAGTGSNSTREAADLTRYAREVGADGSLSVCPYYNKPSQAGIIAHFEFLARECGLPIVLYNIPGRTGVNMTVETILRLATVKNIVGVKEASGSLEQVGKILAAAPKEFAVLSGDDSLTVPIMALGGTGVVATTSNVAPKLMAEMVEACLKGDFETGRRNHAKVAPLFHALFVDTNPVPLKTALSLMGLITNEVRLPLVALSPENTAIVRAALQKTGII